ncbi:MAG: hypothetical protein HP477_11885 [Nitrospira sp.]|nr:hypothetical protein [Nitrospira sp.]
MRDDKLFAWKWNYSLDDLSRDVSLTGLSLGQPTKQDFTIAAGPAVQYVDESARAAQIRIGGDAHVAYTMRLSKPWLLKIMVDYTQISSVYTRIQGNAAQGNLRLQSGLNRLKLASQLFSPQRRLEPSRKQLLLSRDACTFHFHQEN